VETHTIRREVQVILRGNGDGNTPPPLPAARTTTKRDLVTAPRGDGRHPRGPVADRR